MPAAKTPSTHAAYFDTSVHGYIFLNETKVRMIAGRYDLHPNDILVRSSADQAENNHGKPHLVGDRLIAGWGTDASGYYDAEKLLDGYLSEETRAARADARKYDAFSRDAYGA